MLQLGKVLRTVVCYVDWSALGIIFSHLQLLAAGFVSCRYDLDKKFSELVACLSFDSGSNLSHSTDDYNIDTDSSLSLSFLWELHQHRFCCSP